MENTGPNHRMNAAIVDTVQPRLPKRFWWGCALWVAFSVVAMLLRGVRWDENFEFAQAMTGQVPYPDGHPMVQYTRGVFNLQFHASAALLLLTKNPVVLCGLRNLLFILSSVLPPYLVTSLVSRRVLAGHIAALLFLIGVHLEFDGAYPLFIWPGMFSNGQIGIGYALVTVCLMVGGGLRTAGLLLGLLPMIHLGQLPAVWTLAGFLTLWRWRRGQQDRLHVAAIFFCIGLVVCGLFFFVQRSFDLPPPASGPYFADASPWPIWAASVKYHDMHRAIPVGNSHLIAVGLLILGVAAARAESGTNRNRARWQWMFAFSLITMAVLYGTMAVHATLGMNTPYVFLGWLPYRLANHLPVFLIAIVVALLAVDHRQREAATSPATAWLLPAALLMHMSKPIWAEWLDPSLYTRYFQNTDGVLFTLFGAALAAVLWRSREDTPFVTGWALFSFIAWCVLIPFHQFGAACLLAGAMAGLALESNAAAKARSFFAPACGAIALILAAVILRAQFESRQHLPIGDFERQVTQILQERGEDNAMLVSAPHQLLLQAKTGHPVLAEMATTAYVSYMPSLGPSVQKLYRAIYGIDIEKPRAARGTPGWEAVWAERTLGQWSELAQEYDFRYVIVGNTLPLALDPIFVGQFMTLYRVTEPGAERLESYPG